MRSSSGSSHDRSHAPHGEGFEQANTIIRASDADVDNVGIRLFQRLRDIEAGGEGWRRGKRAGCVLASRRAVGGAIVENTVHCATHASDAAAAPLLEYGSDDVTMHRS